MNKQPKNTAKRVREFEKRLGERGGRRLNGINLQPDAAEVLAAFEERGESATKLINRLLIAAKEQLNDSSQDHPV